jgi:hypothetical protein
MSSVFSIFCGTTFSSIFHLFKKQYQCLQELTKHYSNATVEEKFEPFYERIGEIQLWKRNDLTPCHLLFNGLFVYLEFLQFSLGLVFPHHPIFYLPTIPLAVLKNLSGLGHFWPILDWSINL